jgi:archaeosine-15-forming tRNA-guanine transglycosylase
MKSRKHNVPADENIREYIRIILERQFNESIGESISKKGSLSVELSPRTGRLKHVFVDENRILTLRASDGWFTITTLFAELVYKDLGSFFNQVIIESGIDLKGSLLVPGVVDCDKNIRPGDEVVLVDETGKLVGVGRARLSCVAMKSSLKGEAVRVREISNRLHL